MRPRALGSNSQYGQVAFLLPDIVTPARLTDILTPMCAVDLSNQYHIIQLRSQLGFISDSTRG